MSRALRWLVAVVLVAVAGAGIVYVVRNPETQAINAEVRAAASGQFVTLSDGVTHYERVGPDTGRVAVLVHGFSVPYYIWDSTSVALRGAGYRVIRYDVFGRGLSDRPDVAYDSALFVRQLTDLLDSLHVAGPVDLMGLSFGGFITAHFTAAHPGRVRTLTLVDPVAVARSLPAAITTPVVGQWFWQVMQAPGQADGQPSDFLHPEGWPDWIDKYKPQMTYRGFGRALRRSAITAANADYPTLYARVGRTGVPVLLLWGKQDSTVSITNATVLRDRIPGMEFVAVDSAGHLPNLEQSAVVHAVMLSFLDRHRTR